MGAITTAFKKEFADTLYLLAQQSGSKLMSAVRHETNFSGEAKFYNQYGSDEANEKMSRHQDIEYVPDDYSRRMVTPKVAYWSKLVDTEDEISMGLDPKSALMTAGKNAIGRKVDDYIISALRGTALTGSDGLTSTTLPSAQKVSAAASGLTLQKILDAQEIMNSADVPEGDRYFLYAPKQLKDLLKLTEITSIDFNTQKALAAGNMAAFLGFNWIMTTRLPLSSTTRYNIAYHKQGILLASAGGITASIDKVVTKVRQPWQIYADIYCGATRMEEAMVVEVACTES
jgi:hypothetical protein